VLFSSKTKFKNITFFLNKNTAYYKELGVFEKLLPIVYRRLKAIKIKQKVPMNIPQKYFVRELEPSKVCRK